MKKDKYFYTWLFVVIILSLLLLLSIYLGVSGWYFKNDNSRVTDFQVGSLVEIEAHKNSASSVSLNFDGSYIGGEKLEQFVNIKNFDSDGEIYVRAKAYFLSSDNEKSDVNLTTSSSWKYNEEDGYFYFLDKISYQSKVALCSSIVLDEEKPLASRKNYIITFLVESISSQESPSSFWGFDIEE